MKGWCVSLGWLCATKERSLREIDLEEIKPARNWSSWEVVVVRCFIRDRLYPVSSREIRAFHSLLDLLFGAERLSIIRQSSFPMIHNGR